MGGNLILDGMMGLAWIVAFAMVIASLALGAKLGREYAYTAPGVSRMGPRIGRRIASTTFPAGDKTLALRDILSSEHSTLLAFLGTLGRDVDMPHMKDTLIPDLLRLATLAGERPRIVTFCASPCTELEQILTKDSRAQVFVLPDDHRMEISLGVRVTPYALLVDQHGRVLSKGLINNFEHLCRVVVKGGLTRSGKDDLARISRLCQPALPKHLQEYLTATTQVSGEQRPTSS